MLRFRTRHEEAGFIGCMSSGLHLAAGVKSAPFRPARVSKDPKFDSDSIIINVDRE